MPNDYQKQLEEDNWTLKNRLEQFESRCEWLECIHKSHISTGWDIDTFYEVDIDDYRTGNIQNGNSYPLPKDIVKCEIMNIIYEEIIISHALWKTNENKINIRRDYGDWRTSMVTFMVLVYDILRRYKDINKIVMKTGVFLVLERRGCTTENVFTHQKVFADDGEYNQKYFQQGCVISFVRDTQSGKIRRVC